MTIVLEVTVATTRTALKLVPFVEKEESNGKGVTEDRIPAVRNLKFFLTGYIIIHLESLVSPGLALQKCTHFAW